MFFLWNGEQILGKFQVARLFFSLPAPSPSFTPYLSGFNSAHGLDCLHGRHALSATGKIIRMGIG